MNSKNRIFQIAILVGIALLLAGCTNWEKKYKALNVEHENLKGMYEGCANSLDACAADKNRLSSELNQSQETIDQLQSQLAKGGGQQDTGFEVGEVSVDQAAGTITVTLPNSILYAPGKANLKKTYISELDQILATLRERYRGKDIDIVGHTDSDPIKKSKWTDNWQLSAERALSVVRYFEERGWPADRMRAVGAGSARPIASNSTSAGKAKNRRVEVVVKMR
jgi:chemotaxis protein MotB